MGTSKGYILPKTVHWTEAKRAVTSYIRNGSSETKGNAASKFANAMKHDMIAGNSFVSASSNVIAFVNAVSRSGLQQALKEYGRQDLIGRSFSEVCDELIHEFTNFGSTTEDYIAAQSITLAMKELQIDDFANIDTSQFLKEMLIQYIKSSFEFRYEESIRAKKTPEETNKILKEMGKYISGELHEKLTIQELKSVNFNDLKSNQLVEKSLIDAYEILVMFYGEV